MSSWTITPPTVDELRDILAAYGCKATVSGALIIVTHSSGAALEARSNDEAIRAAIKLAREG